MYKRASLILAVLLLLMIVSPAQNLQQIYSRILENLRIKNYKEVIKTGEQVLSKLDKDKKLQHEAYAMFAYFTGSACLGDNQYLKAEPYLRDAVKLLRKMDNKTDELGNACNDLGDLYNRMDRNTEAESLLLESLQVLRSKYTTYHDILFPPYLNLGHVYSSTGRFANAESILLELKKMLPPTSVSQNMILRSDLAVLFVGLGKYEKAEATLSDLLSYAETEFGKQSNEYAHAANVIAIYYGSLQQYGQAEEYIQTALAILEKNNRESVEYLETMNSLGNIYYYTGRYIKADSVYSLVIEQTEKKFGKDLPVYNFSFNGKAITAIELNQYEKAIHILNQIRAMDEKKGNTKTGSYATTLNNIAGAYERSGKPDSAEYFFLRSLKVNEEVFGKEHTEYKKVCFNLANLYWETSRTQDALQYFELGMTTTRNQLQQSFSFSSEEEKLKLMNTFAIERNKFYSFIYQSANEHSGDLYDYSLYTKGLLLNSLKQIGESIRSSNDTSAIRLYHDWQTSKNQLAFWYSKPAAERTINLDSLKKVSEQQEKQLVRLSAAFKNNNEAAAVNWKQVQQQLKPGEAAIEFIACYYFDKSRFTDSILYAALILKSNSQSPELVPLFEQKQLDTILKNIADNNRDNINRLYAGKQHSDSLYKLIWAPIDKRLKDIHTVYYSPFASLNTISFAAVPVNEKELLSDRYHLVQLNSTKALTENAERKISQSDSLVLYGGIAYQADSATLKMQLNKKIFPNEVTNTGSFHAADEQSWNYLPFSEEEVEQIKNSGSKNHFPVTLISGEQATEESFKELQGKRSPAVLHIATHGFFFPDPEKDNKPVNQNVFKYAANPLMRSGLFFAGAYYTWTKNRSFTGLEDGIATAYEIANLYLPNTKLVVLYACETGLGDIRGSDGVWGLQRAFRIAGVKDLVMSLWKVPDKETAEFMNLFYENIFRQQTIADAFIAAQAAMKNKYRNDPYKWAAFILVR
jgi:CHAT domain-containing protein